MGIKRFFDRDLSLNAVQSGKKAEQVVSQALLALNPEHQNLAFWTRDQRRLVLFSEIRSGAGLVFVSVSGLSWHGLAAIQSRCRPPAGPRLKQSAGTAE
jgi:hypothetical protein